MGSTVNRDTQSPQQEKQTTMTLPADAIAIGIGATLGALSRHHAGRVTAEWIATDPHHLGRFPSPDGTQEE